MRAQIPYGYRIENGMAVPHPEEASRLKEFFNLYVNHGCSIAEAKDRAEIDRSERTCRAILTNPVYLGTDYYPRLISPGMMKKAKKTVEEKRKGPAGQKRVRYQATPVRTQFAFLPGDPPADMNRAAWLYGRIQPII